MSCFLIRLFFIKVEFSDCGIRLSCGFFSKLVERIFQLEKENDELKRKLENDYISKEEIKKAIKSLQVKRRIAMDNHKANTANCLLFEIKHLEKFL